MYLALLRLVAAALAADEAAAGATGTPQGAAAPELPSDAPPSRQEAAEYDKAWDEDEETPTDTGDAEPTQTEEAAEEQPPAQDPAEDTTGEQPATDQPPAEQPPTGTEKKPADAAKPGEQPPKEEPTPAADAPASQPSFDFEPAMQRVMAEPLPDTIKVGDKDIKVGSFLTDFPEITAVAATIARRMVEQTVGPILPAMQQYQAQQRHEAFLDAVSAEVPEVRQMVSDPAFSKWLKEQPEPIKELANRYDVKSAAYVLKEYRKSGAKPAAPAKGKVAAVPSPDFERKRQVMAGTVGAKPAARAPAKPNKDDYDAAWDEAMAKD